MGTGGPEWRGWLVQEDRLRARRAPKGDEEGWGVVQPVFMVEVGRSKWDRAPSSLPSWPSKCPSHNEIVTGILTTLLSGHSS